MQCFDALAAGVAKTSDSPRTTGASPDADDDQGEAKIVFGEDQIHDLELLLHWDRGGTEHRAAVFKETCELLGSISFLPNNQAVGWAVNWRIPVANIDVPAMKQGASDIVHPYDKSFTISVRRTGGQIKINEANRNGVRNYEVRSVGVQVGQKEDLEEAMDLVRAFSTYCREASK